MNSPSPCLLTLNRGSSSLKFAIYQLGPPLQRGLSGTVERIGLAGTILRFQDPAGTPTERQSENVPPGASPTTYLLDWLDQRIGAGKIVAVGHRVVHGGEHSAPERVSPALLQDLERLSPYDPEHLPGEIALMEALRVRHPQLPQVACFDTAFHRTLPRMARLLPLPRRYEALGIRRFGFHGLSYAFLLQELSRLGDPAATQGRVILAHLGSGSSLAAVRDGVSIDTTMGFTPTAGLPMSTRTGDLDPGLFSYLARTESLTAEQFQHLVNHESGLLGISETSSDMRDLLDRESSDIRAAEAVSYYCYQTRKWLGAYAAVLGGLDTLVFAGGIGENAAPVRARICAGLDYLGLELSETHNQAAAAVISTAASRVTVRVVPTDEELIIARSVVEVLRLAP